MAERYRKGDLDQAAELAPTLGSKAIERIATALAARERKGWRDALAARVQMSRGADFLEARAEAEHG